MKTPGLLTFTVALVLVFCGAGCFRVSSDTQVLRDAALGNGFGQAEEKIEIGVGFFTVGLARLASKYVDIPPEARTALASLKQAECAVYNVHQRRGTLGSILTQADEAMAQKGSDRIVGVVHEHDLVAVYIPREVHSGRDLKVSVLVLNRKQLVCVTARANAEDLIQLALAKLHDELPGKAFAEYGQPPN